MENEKIGKFIQQLRKEKELTQQELADKLGITDKAVSKWERGLCCPDISLLDDLSKIFEVSVIEILRGKKLDKNELDNNKDLIDSMTYTKEQTKRKAIYSFNIVCITLISFFSLMILFFNMISIKDFNSKYNNLIDKKLNHNKEFELILNNQGKFNDDDYKTVKIYVNLLKDMQEETNKYVGKKNKYKDIIEYYDYISKKYYDIDRESIYDMLTYYGIKNERVNDFNNLNNALVNFYDQKDEILFYNNKIDMEYLSMLYYSVDDIIKYVTFDIIEAGEIDENH